MDSCLFGNLDQHQERLQGNNDFFVLQDTMLDRSLSPRAHHLVVSFRVFVHSGQEAYKV